MKINELLTEATKKLKENHLETPRLDAEVIMAHLRGKDRAYLIMHFDEELDRETEEKFNNLIQRRVQGEPVAYIIGAKEFMDLVLQVDESVLIPRPDTEILVEEVLKELKGHRGKIQALDMGTGSGAIALALAYYVDDLHIIAVDIDPDSLEKAKENGRLLGLEHKVDYLLSDCFDRVDGTVKFDLIVSNPPYINREDMKTLNRSVIGYEPYKALYGGVDGLDFYRRITQQAPKHLKDGGILAFEIGYDQGEAVKKLMEDHGLIQVRIVKDLAGIDRVVIGKSQDSRRDL